MMHKLKWDDLQILLAVAQRGSASAAADFLGLNHSTVLRRVNAFEKTQGVKLFERRTTGYQPTTAGKAMLDAARRIDTAVDDIQREILGQDQRLAGPVQLTTTDSIFCSLIARHLAGFQRRHSDVVVNLTMTNVRLDLNKLDADVSVRPSRNPPERLIGRKACALSFAVYGSARRARAANHDPARVDRWLGISNALRNSTVNTWIDHNVPNSTIVARADSFVALTEMVRADLGVAILPCCLGDAADDLHRFGTPLPELETGLWVLTHPDLRTTARVSALSDFLLKALRSERALIEGKAV